MSVIHREDLFMNRTKIQRFEREIATLLWEIRVNSDISEAQFASKLNISTHKLIRYEGGLDPIPTMLMNKICKALNISVSRFFEMLESNIEDANLSSKTRH